MMINANSLLNIQRLIEQDSLDMVCWIMFSYDSRASDQKRMVVHVKAKVKHQGAIQDTFFQDILVSFDDIWMIKKVLDKTIKNHPAYLDKVTHLKNLMDMWIDHNKGKITSETSPNMFTIDADT